MDAVYVIEELAWVFHKYGYLIVFVGSFIESTPLGWIIPGSLILALGGFFSFGESGTSLIWIIVWGWLGMFLTFTLSYLLGMKSGNYLIKRFKQEKNAQIAKHLLTTHGASVLTTSMLANVTRFWMAYVAGSQNYDFKKFTIYASIASFSWTCFIVIAGFIAGSQKGNLEYYLKNIGYIGWVILIISISTILYFIHKEFKKITHHEPENNSTK